MPKVKISEFDIDPANNTDINSINIAEGCAPSGINNAIRQLMADLKEFQTGAGGDPFNGAVNGTVGATTPASGAFTTLTASSTATLNTLSSSGATITGGSINGTTVGASTASTGAFTTLSASGAFSANGGATLGDASGDALTINSSAVSIPNGLNFDSNTFVIDATNNRVGVGTASPTEALTLGSGNILVPAGSTFYSSGQLYLRAGSGQPLDFGANATNSQMRLTAAGELAVGTTTSVGNSQVTAYGATNGQIAVQNSTNWSRLLQNSNDLYIDNGVGGTAGNIIFRSSSSTSERMRITSTGNVGIGTSSPNYLLSVQANSVQMGFSPQSGIGYLGNYSNAPLGFVVNNAEKMRLDSSGNLGLGVTPSAWLSSARSFDVSGYSSYANFNNATGVINNAYYNASSQWIYKNTAAASNYYQISGSHVWLNAPSGTAGNAITFTQAMTLDASGNLLVGGTTNSFSARIYSLETSATEKNNVALYTTGAHNTCRVALYNDAGSASVQSISGSLSFSSGGVGSTAERMRIDSGGNVLIGTTSRIASTNAPLQAYANGGSTALFQQASTTADNLSLWNSSTTGNNVFVGLYTESSPTARGSITYNRGAGTVAYNTTSDSRLKDNIESAPSALSKINSVQIRSYDWKETGNHVDFGVIAQELIQVAPEAVTEGTDNEDGTIKSPWSVDTAALVPAMIKAMQEQQAIITDLKARIETLESK